MSLPTKEEYEILQALAKNAANSKVYERLGGYDAILCYMLYGKEYGIGPIASISGALRVVQGNVEIAPRTMHAMIRNAGHIIETVEITDKKCVIKGTRRDTGKSETVSFSIDDAVKAGITKNGSWDKYRQDMLYKNALSRISRRLFADVIGPGYIEGEIAEEIEEVKSPKAEETQEAKVDEALSNELSSMLAQCDEGFQKTVILFLEQRFGAPDFALLPVDMYQPIKDKIEAHLTQKVEEKVSIVDIATQAINGDVK